MRGQSLLKYAHLSRCFIPSRVLSSFQFVKLYS